MSTQIEFKPHFGAYISTRCCTYISSSILAFAVVVFLAPQSSLFYTLSTLLFTTYLVWSISGLVFILLSIIIIVCSYYRHLSIIYDQGSGQITLASTIFCWHQTSTFSQSKIGSIKTTQNPLERLFGCQSLSLLTEAAQNAAVTLPALSKNDIDQLTALLKTCNTRA